jgi:hypothetical protein
LVAHILQWIALHRLRSCIAHLSLPDAPRRSLWLVFMLRCSEASQLEIRLGEGPSTIPQIQLNNPSLSAYIVISLLL